jgi:hypothetical protein
MSKVWAIVLSPIALGALGLLVYHYAVVGSLERKLANAEKALIKLQDEVDAADTEVRAVASRVVSLPSADPAPPAVIPADVEALMRRTTALERQMSLAMTVLQAAPKTEAVQDALASLREDMDLLLSREWDRLDAEALALLEPDAGAEGEAAASEVDAGAEEAEAVAEADEAQEEDLWGALEEEAEAAWLRSYADLAQLDPGQEARLGEVIGTLKEREQSIVADVLRGDKSTTQAQTELRELLQQTHSDLGRFLSNRQRDALREEIRRRSNLWLNLSAIGL